MTRDELKNYFKQGKIPTESNFSELIDFMASKDVGIRNIKNENVWIFYSNNSSKLLPVIFVKAEVSGSINEWNEGILKFAVINSDNAQEFINSLDVNDILLASDDSILNQYTQIVDQLVWCKLWPNEKVEEPMQVTIFCNLSDNKPYSLIFKLAYFNADKKILIPVEYLALRRNTGHISPTDVTPYTINPGHISITNVTPYTIKVGTDPLVIKELWDNIKTMQGYKDGYIVYSGVYNDVINLISHFE